MALSSLQLVLFSLFLFTFIAAPVILGRDLRSSKSSPLLFLERLHGCRKGDNIEEIHDLKIYLQHYGYLSGDAENNVFDELLESAIKTYQNNFNLNASGVLDARTLAQMSKPRCGVPDFFNGTATRMRSGEGHFHMSSYYTFFPRSPKWPISKRHLTYTFIDNYPSKFIEPVSRAFSQWASNSHFTFSETRNFRAADIRISFKRGSHGDGSPFDGSGGVLAHAFAPTDGRLHLDGDETWTAGYDSNAFVVETVALHEIGHILGLGHTSDGGAIMFPTIGRGVIKGLNGDDIAGIHALYR